MTILTRNDAGFTLIEVMVSIVIMMVGMLGLLSALNIADDANLKNQVRDEAVAIGEKYMNIQRGKAFGAGFDNLSATYGPRYEPSRLRAANKQYTVNMSTDVLSTDTKTPCKQVRIVVEWTYKGVAYRNELTSPVSVNVSE